jgi:hypothetical protein
VKGIVTMLGRHIGLEDPALGKCSRMTLSGPPVRHADPPNYPIADVMASHISPKSPKK